MNCGKYTVGILLMLLEQWGSISSFLSLKNLQKNKNRKHVIGNFRKMTCFLLVQKRGNGT